MGELTANRDRAIFTYCHISSILQSFYGAQKAQAQFIDKHMVRINIKK